MTTERYNKVCDRLLTVWLYVFLGAAVPIIHGDALTPLFWIAGIVCLGISTVCVFIGGFGLILVGGYFLLAVCWCCLWPFGLEDRVEWGS